MAVEKISPGVWRSTLLPWSTFDSEMAATHYDNEQQMINAAAAERSGEDYLDSLPASAVRDLELTFRKNMDLSSEPVREFTELEFNRFLSNHERFIQSVENCRRLGAFLTGQGLYPPFSNTQLSEAYDALVRLGHLDLHPVRR